MSLLGPLYGGGFWVAFRQLVAVSACRRSCRQPVRPPSSSSFKGATLPPGAGQPMNQLPC